MKNLWDKFTDRFGTSFIHPQFLLRRHLAQALVEAKRRAQGKLVDIGCGRMPYRKSLESLVEQYVGVDHPRVSKLYQGEVKPDVLADAKNLPFENNAFDIALMLQVLEYLDEPQTALNEAARILKKGGVLILTSPFLYPIHDQPFDRNRFTDTAIREMLKKAGLKILKLETQGNFWDFWFLNLNVHLLRRIKDSYPLILIFVASPVVVISNILGVLASKITRIPKKQNYFPLNYLVIAKKR